MKQLHKISLILLSILLSISANAKNDTLFISSVIKKATIYPSGARLSRTGEVRIKKGISTVIFKDVTDMFSSKGIQIKSNRAVKLLGIMARKNYKNVKETNKEISTLTKKYNLLAKKINKENAILLVFIDEKTMILNNKKVISKQKELTIEEITKIADFFRKRMNEIKTKKLDTDNKVKKMKEEMLTIKRQLKELNARKKSVTNEIVVSLSSTFVQKINLTAEYFTNNAGWTPIYDIRVDDISKPVNLIYKADVFQNTANDWKNVKIKLSTNNPSYTNTQPTIKPHKLYFISYNNSYSKKQSNSSRATHVFEIKNKYSVPSDGKNHSIEVEKYALNADYEYFAVPKLDKKAYLTARVTDWEKYHLLNGKTNLFFQGTFVGESNLDLNTASDTIDISLGEDKNVLIERKNMKSYNKKQFVGNKQVEERMFEITVRNNKKKKIRLRIEDQIPVSKNDAITVKLVNVEKGKLTEVDGKITWIIEQESNKSNKLKFHYSVKYPKREKVILE